MTIIEKAVESAVTRNARQDHPLSISGLAGDIGIPTDTVCDLLKNMAADGRLGVEIDDLDNATAVRVTRIVCHGHVVTQQQLEVLSREEAGFETFEQADGYDVRCSVLPERDGQDGTTGRYLLNIVQDPGPDATVLVEDQVFAPEPGESPIEARSRAWAFWDDYKLDLDGVFDPVDCAEDAWEWLSDIGMTVAPILDGSVWNISGVAIGDSNVVSVVNEAKRRRICDELRFRTMLAADDFDPITATTADPPAADNLKLPESNDEKPAAKPKPNAAKDDEPQYAGVLSESSDSLTESP